MEMLVAEELGHELLLGEDDGSEESRMCSARREAFSAGAEMGAIWRSWLPAAAARRKAGGAGRGGLGRLQGLGLLLPDRGREELRSGLAGHGRPSGVLVGETRWRDWLRGDFFLIRRISMRRRQEEGRRSGGSLEIRDLV